MKKLVLYPFLPEHIAIVKYHSLWNREYYINELVSPTGLGYGGKDAGVLDNRNLLDISVKDDLNEAIKENDGIFVPSGNSNKLAYSNIYNIICDIAKRGKDIICNIHLTKRELSELKDICSKYGSKFVYSLLEERGWTRTKAIGKYTPSVPIIFIGSIFAEANTFEVMLSIANCFHDDGYKITIIGEAPELNFYGFYGSSILSDLSKGKIPGNDISFTITLLNHYIHYIESKERPDVILIQIPGGMMDSIDFPNESGVYAYIISRAIQPDYLIGCTLFSEINENDLKFTSEEVERRFGYPIDSIHLSNKGINYSSSLQKQKMEFIYHPIEKTYQYIPKIKSQIPVYNLLDSQQLKIIYNNIINELSGE